MRAKLLSYCKEFERKPRPAAPTQQPHSPGRTRGWCTPRWSMSPRRNCRRWDHSAGRAGRCRLQRATCNTAHGTFGVGALTSVAATCMTQQATDWPAKCWTERPKRVYSNATPITACNQAGAMRFIGSAACGMVAHAIRCQSRTKHETGAPVVTTADVTS